MKETRWKYKNTRDYGIAGKYQQTRSELPGKRTANHLNERVITTSEM
jgi:hypothetical protein